MTEPNSVLEQVIDDLLLTVDQVKAGQTDELETRVADRVSDHFMPTLIAWVGKNRDQQSGAQVSAEIVSSAVAEYVAAHAVLASGLLSWAAEQTGLSVGEVLAGVRARTTGEGDA